MKRQRGPSRPGSHRSAVQPLIALGAALLVSYLVMWLTVVSPARERGSDFSASYVAGLLIREGHAAALYDQGVERARHLLLLPAPAVFDLPFLTPPTTAVIAVPFTVLGPGAAFRLFSLMQLALIAAAAVIAARAAPWPSRVRPGVGIAAILLGAAGAATAVVLLLGQWDGVGAIGLALAYASWRRGKSDQAAAWLAASAMLAKPHLAIGLGAFLLGRRRPRELLAAGVATLAVALSWLAIAGPDGMSAYVATLSTTIGHTPPSSTMGLTGLLTSWLGETAPIEWVAIGLGVVLLAGCVALGARSRNPRLLEVCLGGAVALSLLATPHLLAHDLCLLAPVFAWMVAWTSDRDETGGAVVRWPGPASFRLLMAWLVLNVVTARDAGGGGVGPPGRLVPWALLGCGIAALVLTGTRRRQPGPG